MENLPRIILGVVIALVLVFGVSLAFRGDEDTWLCVAGAWTRHGNPSAPMPETPCPAPMADARNTEYSIDGKPVKLTNGHAESPAAPGSASTLSTDVWTVSKEGDLNGDGIPDAAVVLAQTGGGSGTFYYLAAAVGMGTRFQGTNAILLGDRIAPQDVSITSGQILANYADRKPTDSFAVQPSVGKTMYAILVNGKLEEGGSLSRQNLITLSAPATNAVVKSPLTLAGEARGPWYFEASFPAVLQDASGTVLAQAPMQAKGEWMTEEFVPFQGILTFAAQPSGSEGLLILKKDNPSGDPAKDDSVRIPVRF